MQGAMKCLVYLDVIELDLVPQKYTWQCVPHFYLNPTSTTTTRLMAAMKPSYPILNSKERTLMTLVR